MFLGVAVVEWSAPRLDDWEVRCSNPASLGNIFRLPLNFGKYYGENQLRLVRMDGWMRARVYIERA